MACYEFNVLTVVLTAIGIIVFIYENKKKQGSQYTPLGDPPQNKGHVRNNIFYLGALSSI